MHGYQPYKKNYFSQQKKRKLVSILIPVVFIAVAAVLFLTWPKTGNDEKISTPAMSERRSPAMEQANESEPDQYPAGESNDENLLPLPEIQADTRQNSTPDEASRSVQIDKTTNTREPAQEEEWQSDIDMEREQGVSIFEDVIRQCADTREQIGQLKTEYDSSCTGIIYDTFGNPINKANTEQCIKLMNEINNMTAELQDNLQLSMENARKAGVYPGQIRDILEKYGFENL